MPERDFIPFRNVLAGYVTPPSVPKGGVGNPAETFQKDVQHPSGGKLSSPEEPFLIAITACVNHPWMPGTRPGMT